MPRDSVGKRPYLPPTQLRELEPIEAIGRLEKATEAGNAQAAVLLTLIYMEGHGVPRSNEKAMFFLRRAMEIDAAHALASLSRHWRSVLEAIMSFAEEASRQLEPTSGLRPEVLAILTELQDVHSRLGAIASENADRAA